MNCIDTGTVVLAAPGREAAGRRALRVTLLLVAVALMSLGDLYMTMTHLTGVGMMEDNPLARAIMSYNSPGLLAAWKLASVTLALSILFWARRTRHGEWAAWFCAGVLAWLTVRWVRYSDDLASLTPAIAQIAETDHRWMAIEQP